MIAPTSLIPIHDQNPTRNFSIFTVVLIGLNVLAFLITPQLGSGNSPELEEFFFTWGLIPAEIQSGQPLLIPGKSIYLSVFTSMFLHGGILHIAGNMLFLWVFGNNIEDELGKIRFVIFYLVAGVAAAATHVALSPGSPIPTIGASGAVSGLLGAYIVLYPRHRVTSVMFLFYFVRLIQLPAYVVLGIWFVFQFFSPSGVAWLAHVGGFVAGAALIVPFGGKRQAKPPITYRR